MKRSNNIYNYESPKSMNEETHFFLHKGRITIKAFLLRVLFAICLVGTFGAIYHEYALPKKESKIELNDIGEKVIRDSTFETSFMIFENFVFYVLPFIMLIFIIIQGIKRIHDSNRTGWWLLVPLYNIVLLFSKGTKGNNDYGVTPRKPKQIKYFDQLEENQ